MLMHSCCCIFISVMGGFVQMLKDFKNLLKMSLKILFIKRKRKFPSIPSLPLFRPAGPSLRWPSSPLLPCAPQPPASHGPARSRPSYRRRSLGPARAQLPPRALHRASAASNLAPPVRAILNLLPHITEPTKS